MPAHNESVASQCNIHSQLSCCSDGRDLNTLCKPLVVDYVRSPAYWYVSHLTKRPASCSCRSSDGWWMLINSHNKMCIGFKLPFKLSFPFKTASRQPPPIIPVIDSVSALVSIHDSNVLHLHRHLPHPWPYHQRPASFMCCWRVPFHVFWMIPSAACASPTVVSFLHHNSVSCLCTFRSM